MTKKKSRHSDVFARRLQSLMKSKGLTQQQIADAAEVSRPAVVKWLRGTVPGASELFNLAAKNGVTTEWFLKVEPGANTSKHEVMLDDSSKLTDDVGVKSEITSLPELVDKLRKLTQERGAKIALANEMEVSRQAVDQWLDGTSKPTAEMTFELLKWVKQGGCKK